MSDVAQIDVTKAELSELYRYAFEQQKLVTEFLVKFQQAQENVTLIQAEITRRIEAEKCAA